MNFENTPSFASELDSKDALSHFRSQFYIPKTAEGEEEVYLCGNSLGLQPKRSKDYISIEMEKWRHRGVKGHFSGDYPWMPYHEFLRSGAAAITGAKESEVVCMNSLTVNLHLLMVSFYQPSPKRHKILIEDHAFPSDRYAVESQLRFRGFDPSNACIKLGSKSEGLDLDISAWQEVFEKHGDEIALVLIPGVQYFTGELADIERITQLAKKHGCIVGVDLAHAAGNVELDLHDWEVDFAVWCHYKYLNSGPGAVAGAFVHSRHLKRTDLQRFCGWWGHEQNTRFKMPESFRASESADAWQLSNPPIFALAPIRAAYDVLHEAGGVTKLRQKSIKLTGYLEFLLKENCSESIEILSPDQPGRRGCQLSLRVTEKASTSQTGLDVFNHLSDSGVTVDWREPDVIRVAPVPLYNRFTDVYRFVEILSRSFNHE